MLMMCFMNICSVLSPLPRLPAPSGLSHATPPGWQHQEEVPELRKADDDVREAGVMAEAGQDVGSTARKIEQKST
jgi:hypothetical protein